MAFSKQDTIPWYQDTSVYGVNKATEFGYNIEVMDIISSYNDILASNDTSLISRVNAANASLESKARAQDVLNGIVCLIALVYFTFSAIRFCEISNIKTTPKQRKARLAIQTLMSYDVLVVVMCIVQGILHYADFRDDEGKDKCNVIMKIVGAIYVSTNGLLYCLMIQRASAILNSKIFIGHRAIHATKTLMQNFIRSIPAFLLFPFFSTYGARTPHLCVNIVPQTPAILFITIDTIASLTLLLLLVYPLYTMVPTRIETTTVGSNTHTNIENEMDRAIQRTAMREKLTKVVRKNVLYSSVAMSTTCLSMFSKLYVVVQVDLPTIDNLAFLGIYLDSMMFTMIDICINMYVAHSLTTVWKPEFLLQMTGTKKDGQNSSRVSPASERIHKYDNKSGRRTANAGDNTYTTGGVLAENHSYVVSSFHEYD